MIRRTLLTLLALVLALVTITAACGDDDSADPSSGDDRAADDAAADDPSGDAAAGDSADDPEAAEGGDSGDAGDDGDVSAQLGVDREFTGEGSEAFCGEVESMREAGQDAAGVDDAAFADAMMAITPPAEIASEWTNLFTLQKAIAADPSGGALAAMSQEALDEWAVDGNVVAAYLGDVCGMADAGG